MKEFTYKDASIYIAKKWGDELWGNKTTLIPAILLTYISSTQAEEKFTCDQELLSCKFYYTQLAIGVKEEINQCKMIVDKQYKEIIKCSDLTKITKKILENLCDIIKSANIEIEMPDMCDMNSQEACYKNLGSCLEGEL